MNRDERFDRGKERERFMVLLCLVLIGLIFLRPTIGFPYEREGIPEKEYQTEKEKIALKDRFKLDFSIGYGYSYSQILTGMYGPDPKLDAYLKKLNMKFSDPYSILGLTACYAITPRLGVYAAVPFGVVGVKEQEKTGTLAYLSEKKKVKFGLGDIYGGIWYQLISEEKYIPSLVLMLNGNSPLAKYWPLGDGFWDITGGGQIRKQLFKSFYLFGEGDYTYRPERNDIEPGSIISYGGGMGLLVGEMVIEAALKAATINETKQNGEMLFEKDKDSAFSLRLRTNAWKGRSFNLTISNLDEGIKFERNVFGFEFSMSIF